MQPVNLPAKQCPLQSWVLAKSISSITLFCSNSEEDGFLTSEWCLSLRVVLSLLSLQGGKQFSSCTASEFCPVFNNVVYHKGNFLSCCWPSLRYLLYFFLSQTELWSSRTAVARLHRQTSWLVKILRNGWIPNTESTALISTTHIR